MKVDTDLCVQFVVDNYGVSCVAAKNILDDYKLWKETELKRTGKLTITGDKTDKYDEGEDEEDE